jgi:spore germination protein YaaH
MVVPFITCVRWDAAAKSPWFDYRTSQGHIHQLWYDDVESLTLKCELAKSLHIRGTAPCTCRVAIMPISGG